MPDVRTETVGEEQYEEKDRGIVLLYDSDHYRWMAGVEAVPSEEMDVEKDEIQREVTASGF